MRKNDKSIKYQNNQENIVHLLVLTMSSVPICTVHVFVFLLPMSQLTVGQLFYTWRLHYTVCAVVFNKSRLVTK